MFPDLGEDFFEQKLRVAVAETVVLKAAIVPVLDLFIPPGQHTRTDENCDGHWHLTFCNQVVKDNRDAPVALFLDHCRAVLKDHHAGRLVRFVLRRHINPIVPHRAGKNLTGPGVLFQRAFRHISVPLRIRAKLVFFSRKLRREQNQNGQNDRSHGFHRDYPPREPNILTRRRMD